jgi:uncharacterized iron-regulated protein
MMKSYSLAALCACSLSVLLVCNTWPIARAIAEPVANRSSEVKVRSPEVRARQLAAEWADARVIYLGETHDREADHRAQLAIIQALQAQNPKVAIAMEMFQRPYQGAIDGYLAGELDEAQLVEQTEYDRRWGFPWENYAPILRFAKAQQLPTLALNVPSEVTRKLAREGWESLDEGDRQYIPPREQIDLDNEDYRALLRGVYEQHAQAGHGSSEDLDRFFFVQVLWDETMAERIAEFLKDNEDYQVVVLTGSGHVVYGYGIPDRVARRMGDRRDFVQRSLVFDPPESLPNPGGRAIADFVWTHDPTASGDQSKSD